MEWTANSLHERQGLKGLSSKINQDIELQQL
jgi:hypothetical protein